MKKLLGMTLALAMFVPAGANAELLKNFKMSGKIDMQGTAARNVGDFQTSRNVPAAVDANTGQDRLGDMQTRVIVSGDWDVLDDVHARVTLRKNNRVWGGASETIQTGIWAAFNIDESYIKIDKLGGHVDATLGRQFIGEEGDLVAYYGPRTNIYGMRVDSLDAAKFDMSGEHWGLTMLSGKPDQSATIGAPVAGAQDIRAIILGCKGHENVQVKGYLWNRATHNANGPVGTPANTVDAGAKNGNLYVAGIKATVKVGPAWLKAEYDKNFGEARRQETATQSGAAKYTGWAGLLNAGAKVEAGSLGMITGWGEFGYGTGTADSKSNKDSGFQSINTDYRPGSLFGRFATGSSYVLANLNGGAASPASNGLSNRITKGLGVKMTPASLNKLTVAVSAWDFSFQHTGRKDSIQGAQPSIGANGNRHIGNEYDAEFAWQHSENVLVKLGAASFQPGGFLIETQKLANVTRGVNPAYMLTSDFSVKF